ncbi:AAA family ATPase [Rhodopseudomonas sp. HC1]|uniref:ATP-binding protein n=1 Tax=Rhodopseudomonas infernalis TaxID=2897386 RepID=UPI001EE7EAD1|nr:YhaN family protein [Rhodopseudomonas infernalis]MCG6205794.1 AAA family ATPase [Rhodopseudomonas infernalis]
MRIEQLALERYGIFTDRIVPFAPQASLHIVLGANEAGKTSALTAIGDLLFGFGARTDYDFLHDSKLLRLGGSFRHSDGRLITARRRKGNKNTLLDAENQPLPDDHFAALLGDVSRTTFNSEFGMTAPALRAGGDELLGAGGRLAETLAASSAGMAELSRIKDRLQQQADELFTPRKSAGKPFYLAAERRDAADKELRDAIVTRDALRQAQASVEQAAAELEKLKAEHAACGSTLARWQRTLRVRSQLSRLDRIEAELSGFADLPQVAAQTLAEWRAALDSKTAIEAEIATLDAAAAADAAEIATIHIDEALLGEAGTIVALRERLGAVRKAASDLPRRRHDRASAEAALDDCARKLGLASHVELLAALPTEPALADARDRLEKIRRATQELADIEARYERAKREREVQDAAGDDPHLIDLEPLRQRFDALGDIPAQEERLRRDRAALAIEFEAIGNAVAALDPTPGAPDRVRALPVPDHATISKFASAFELSETELKRLDTEIAKFDDAIAAAEAELARLSSSGPVPTKADLIAARQTRDDRLGALYGGLDGDRDERRQRFDGVAEASRAIDGITDSLLTDTERATRHEDAQRRIAETRGDRERVVAKRSGLRQGLFNITEGWAKAWAASGLQPLGAAEMLRWRERFDEIVGKLAKCDLQRAAIDAQAMALNDGRTAILGFLGSVGRHGDPSAPAGALYREAKARYDQLVAAWSDAKARAAALARIERDLAEADTARETCERSLADQRQHWPLTMGAIGLAADASPAQAEAALSVWGAVGVPRANLDRESRSVDTITSDLQEFDRDVAGLLAHVAPDLGNLAAQEAVPRLAERLDDARRASEACRRLHDNAAKRAINRGALVSRLEASLDTLLHAGDTLGADIAAVPELLARLAIRLQLQTEQKELRRHLLEIGDGYDETALRHERDGVDLDRLQADIASATEQQAGLFKDIGDASAAHYQRQRELEALTKGRDAAGAAGRRREAGAELLSVAEDWLLRSAAALLARRVVELHRAKVQDPMVARAGELFALATAEAFAGLGIDYDEDEPTLVARRASGERVPLSGLSEGTRDQLFLALRLALLERRTSEPLPFIGDDLLASFDDRRTLATLRLLAAAGRQRQMILFTHHRHVADLAQSLTDHQVDLIQL